MWIVEEVKIVKLQGLLLFSENPAALVAFYGKVFQKNPDWTGGDFSGFALENEWLTIGPHDKVHGTNPQPERIMFNLETDDVEEEFERIKEMGAEVIAEPYEPAEAEDMMLATFADPDGNYFQLATPFSE